MNSGTPMDTIMDGTGSISPSDEVLGQILTELREFRKEVNDRNGHEENAGRVGSRVPAIQTGNENVQTNSNHPLPEIPPPLPVRPAYEQTNSVPGEFPGNTNTEETASGACPNLHQDPLDMERATMQSYYTAEMKKLADEIEAKKELWEEARNKNVELNKQLTEQNAKVMKLQKMMVRAGRNDSSPIDGDISAQFVLLKSDILQMVKSHLSYPENKPSPGASPDLGELYLRKVVASALHEEFFSREAMPFGYGDRLLEKNPLRKFEQTLRESPCDDSAIKEWRLATVKVCKLLDQDLDEYSVAISDQIWSKRLHHYHHVRNSFQKRDKLIAARKDLDSLCRKAADIAILFRGSNIEYEWEQDRTSLKSLEVLPKDHEIIGTKGPRPTEESNFEIAYIVFGGVVRGDKSTGLLENGRVRLSKTQVVIREPKP
ncbi:hypothetical protein B0J14DRAFT_685510 [Halenospora varia]|nr:hypothetical protein B0J14DRAFT_685510 [Halenospora varia]